MALPNIGAGNRDDAFYRYKIPKLITKIEGRGNDIKTNVVNMVDVAKALSRHPAYTTKYFGCELGAQSKFDEKTGTSIVNGAHDTTKLAALLENFIKKYVQCYGCGNPETEVVITKTQLITLKCAACGYLSDVDMRDKLTTFILKNPPEQKKGGNFTMAESSSYSLVHRILEIVNVITSIGDFKTHKKECNNLTRRVKLLVPIFEEARDMRLSFSGEGLECIDALEAALTRAKVLLLLCNKGSKLYLILQHQNVAKQFSMLNTALGKALDKSSSLDISDEVREQVELVHLQFQRSKGSEDPLDARLHSELASALDEKHGHSKAELERLAELFKFDTARALMRELQALHGMRIGKEPVAVGILVTEPDFEQLLGLLNEFRILFPQEDLEQDDPELRKLQVAERAGVEKSSMQSASDLGSDKGTLNIPDDFKCPISLDLMKDPVIIATGQTYERSCIQKWLDSGKRTCPKTGSSLPHLNLTPNHVLRSVIAEWCTLHGIELPKKPQCSAEDKAAIDKLVAKLQDPSPDLQRSAAHDIRLKAKMDVNHRICIAEQGAIPLLVGLLRSPDEKTQEHAVTALLNLSINDNNKGRIVSAGAIEPIVEVLRNSSTEARENAAATLFSLSLVDDNKVTIGNSGAIPALVALLHDGTARGKKDAATALFNLSIYQGNKARAVQAGVVPPLMKLLAEQPATMLDEALAILAILATNTEGRYAICMVGPTAVWLRIIASESPRNKENAAAILLALCSHDREYAQQARQANASLALTGLTRSRDATSRAKRKATALLELLKKAEPETLGQGVDRVRI